MKEVRNIEQKRRREDEERKEGRKEGKKKAKR